MGLWGNIQKEDQTKCEIGSKIAYERIMVFLVQYDRSSHSVKSLRVVFMEFY